MAIHITTEKALRLLRPIVYERLETRCYQSDHSDNVVALVQVATRHHADPPSSASNLKRGNRWGGPTTVTEGDGLESAADRRQARPRPFKSEPGPNEWRTQGRKIQKGVKGKMMNLRQKGESERKCSLSAVTPDFPYGWTRRYRHHRPSLPSQAPAATSISFES